MRQNTHEEAHHSLRATDVAHLLSTQHLPFVRDANATGFFVRTQDFAQVQIDHRNIAALAATLDLDLIHLTAAFDSAASWSADYFHELARTVRSTGSTAWRSETPFLFLLALIAIGGDAVTVDHLVSIGWDETAAARTIAAARRVRESRH